ncbi:hypothetical protein D9981_08510 [Pseudoalteromonas phenolica O-BC30]|nr:hypothetical protein D9981_08510 [Pseudoalteromonas phenolica O-BC30]
MTATKKFSFDRGFIAGTLWGASAVFFICSGYLLSEFNGDNFSPLSFFYYPNNGYCTFNRLF